MAEVVGVAFPRVTRRRVGVRDRGREPRQRGQPDQEPARRPGSSWRAPEPERRAERFDRPSAILHLTGLSVTTASETTTTKTTAKR
jgi:hypothetical protein